MTLTTRLSAADNLSIDIQPGRWRLLLAQQDSGEGDSSLSFNGTRERVLLDAASGRAIRYTNSFASKRKLPLETLPTEHIRQVVTGWSEGDAKWHLGLMLVNEMATERGSRWVEIASWHDPSQMEYDSDVAQAASALAEVLGVPFRPIPPKVAPEVAAPVKELPALPLKFGIWTLERAPLEHGGEYTGTRDVLRFTRAGSWTRSRLIRMAWYGLWLVVYVVLSVATLTTKLALPNSGMMLPNPQILPFLGLGAAGVLAILIVSIVMDLMTNPSQIVVDPASHSIIGLSGGGERWRYESDDVDSVYASQVVGQRGEKRTLYHGELNLRLNGQRFFSVLRMEQEEERLAERGERPIDMVEPLDAGHAETDLQAAALYLADALGRKPCWYDQRTQ